MGLFISIHNTVSSAYFLFQLNTLVKLDVGGSIINGKLMCTLRLWFFNSFPVWLYRSAANAV